MEELKTMACLSQVGQGLKGAGVTASFGRAVQKQPKWQQI